MQKASSKDDKSHYDPPLQSLKHLYILQPMSPSYSLSQPGSSLSNQGTHFTKQKMN